MNRAPLKRWAVVADPGLYGYAAQRGFEHLRQLYHEYRQLIGGQDPTTRSIARRDRIDIPTLAGVTIGAGTSFGPHGRLLAHSSPAGAPPGRLQIGASALMSTDFFAECYTGQILQIGDHSTFGTHCTFIGDVSIGSHCVFASFVFGSTGHHEALAHPSWLIHDQDLALTADSDWARQTSRPIVVGEDCWVGWNVFLKEGVQVGRGAIVGAHSVVTKDVEPYAIVAGVPARPIGRRLDFSPPASVQAGLDAHLPYFYQGFRVRREDRRSSPEMIGAGPKTRLVLKGGAARLITLDGRWDPRAAAGTTIDVSINGVPAGSVRRDDGRFRQEIAVRPAPRQDGLRILSKFTVVDLTVETAEPGSHPFALRSAHVALEDGPKVT